MKILITGATGFIGSRLIIFLNSLGHEVIGLSRNLQLTKAGDKSQYYPYHLGAPFSSEIINFLPEVVIHLAWEGIPNFSREMSIINLNANIRFLQELEKITSIKKIIISGSCWEYSGSSGACFETDISIPNTYFVWAKYSVHSLFKIFCDERDLYFDWLRIFYVYGPGQRAASLIPTILESIKHGAMPKINNIFSANDYIYIDDVVHAISRAVDIDKSLGIVNIGSGVLTQTKEVLRICQNLYDLPMPTEDNSASSVGIYANISKAKTLMDWIPQYSLYQGIRETYKVF